MLNRDYFEKTNTAELKEFQREKNNKSDLVVLTTESDGKITPNSLSVTSSTTE